MMDAPPIPSIAISIFPESDEVAEVARLAADDRRMARAHVAVENGGIRAAIELYRKSKTPDLLIVESQDDLAHLLPSLDELADHCLPGTRVVVIGHRNDVNHYRALTAAGVSDYLAVPIDALGLVAAVSRLYGDGQAGTSGRLISFLGTRGGAGSSVIAHNTAWIIADQIGRDVVLGDVDLRFGTAGLDFNLDRMQGGFAEVLENASRFDGSMLERVSAKPHERLSVLASPTSLDKKYDLNDADFDRLVEFARKLGGYTVLDLPHAWSKWTRKLLAASDEIVLVATPDLSSLRNAKMQLAFIKATRPNDLPPRLLLNQVGVPKRPEIAPQKFAEALELELAGTVPFDPHLFGTAAGTGKMLDQISAKAAATRAVARLSREIVGDTVKHSRRDRGALAQLMRWRRGS